MFSLQDKVVVVTGGTGVLGDAFVKGITGSGGKAVILGRNREEGESRVQQVKESGGEAMFIVADVLNEKMTFRGLPEVYWRLTVVG